jgi:hypothetical protein
MVRLPFVLVIGFVLLAGRAQAQDAIGFVKQVAGTAAIIRDGQRMPVSIAMAVQEHDQLETGRDGELGITFRDDTRISLGANTRLDVGRFVFKPAEKDYGIVFNILVGTMQYISGITAKIAPEAVSITTPKFVVAVRGTRLLIRTEN